MTFAILPIAEKLLGSLATIAAGAADSASSVDVPKASAAADTTDFTRALDGLDQTAGAAKSHFGAHVVGKGAESAAG
jgi:hypothetical protein